MKFGVIYQSFDPPPVFLEYVRAVEDLGFDDLWVCDSSLHARDVIAYLTLAAVNSARIRLGVSVFQPYTRHPAINVNAMATINEISGGRAMMVRRRSGGDTAVCAMSTSSCSLVTHCKGDDARSRARMKSQRSNVLGHPGPVPSSPVKR